MHILFFLFSFSLLFSTPIQIGKETLEVEIVDTPAAIAKGLMGRKNLPEGQGMLFVYQRPHVLNFWMKNTLIPLSIAFFDEEKILIRCLDMEPSPGTREKDLEIYSSGTPALYALEVPQGWFKKCGIAKGAKFSFLHPSNRLK